MEGRGGTGECAVAKKTSSEGFEWQSRVTCGHDNSGQVSLAVPTKLKKLPTCCCAVQHHTLPVVTLPVEFLKLFFVCARRYHSWWAICRVGGAGGGLR
jgi:hypothetical protein